MSIWVNFVQKNYFELLWISGTMLLFWSAISCFLASSSTTMCNFTVLVTCGCLFGSCDPRLAHLLIIAGEVCSTTGWTTEYIQLILSDTEQRKKIIIMIYAVMFWSTLFLFIYFLLAVLVMLFFSSNVSCCNASNFSELWASVVLIISYFSFHFVKGQQWLAQSAHNKNVLVLINCGMMDIEIYWIGVKLVNVWTLRQDQLWTTALYYKYIYAGSAYRKLNLQKHLWHLEKNESYWYFVDLSNSKISGRNKKFSHTHILQAYMWADVARHCSTEKQTHYMSWSQFFNYNWRDHCHTGI